MTTLKKHTLTLAVFIYFVYLSYAVWEVLNNALTIRLRMAVQTGWIIGLLITLVLVFWIEFQKPAVVYDRLTELWNQVHRWNRWFRLLIFLVLVLIPIPLVFTGISRGLTLNLWFRWAIFFPIYFLATLFLPFNSPKEYWVRLCLSMLIGAYIFTIGGQLILVSNYPFSIGWSEGNRFYDYSLIFGRNIYQHDGNLEIPYFSPGRYGLWGIWFLIPNLPIGFHRLWNAILWFLPPLILGWLIARRSTPKEFRPLVALWAALFLLQGPVLAPLILAAALVLITDASSLWKRSISNGVASLYAGLSRWTWSIAPGAWGALLALFSPLADQQQPIKRRIEIVALIALAGSLPGILVNWSRLLAPKENTFSLSQPLLWDRLLPNPIYEPGILLGLTIATLPLIVLLVWLIASRRWKLDFLQILATLGISLGFLTAGLIASTKIGGGSNLHNMDMFLITLMVLVKTYLDNHELTALSWPNWANVVLALCILVPIWSSLSAGLPVDLPSQKEVGEAIETINKQVSRTQEKGEVLFMDQRQLLTFGYVQDVDLVPEYEKKYLMDQAMAANEAFFNEFYKDLSKQRFAMIVTETLNTHYQEDDVAFAQENNAWVKWVSEPVLCYYVPKLRLRPFNIQLLIPRQESKICSKDFGSNAELEKP